MFIRKYPLFDENDGEGKDLDNKKSEVKEPENKSDPEPEKKTTEKEPEKEPQNNRSDKEAELLREVMKKKEALQTLESSLQDLKTQNDELTKFKQEYDAKKEADELSQLEQDKEWETIKERMRTKAEQDKQEALEAAVNPLQESLTQSAEKIAKLESQLEKSLRTSKFSSVDLKEYTISNKQGQRMFDDFFDYEDGNLIPYDKPKGESDRAMKVDKNGEPMEFEAAFAEILKSDPDHDNIALANLRDGAGSGTDSFKVKPKEKERGSLDKIKDGISAISAAQ